MSGDLSADEIREKIEAGSEAWRDIIPFGQHDRFVGRVQQAVTLYLSLISPKDLRDELEGFERATRSPTAPIGQLVAGLSADAQHILSRSGPLPLPPNNPSASGAYYTDIRSRLVRGQRWKSEGDKRRKVTEIVGPPKRMGRPPDADIDALVSYISVAYADAVGKSTTGSWSGENESAVERIVGDVFANLGVDAAYSAIKAVQRHIEQRDELKYKPLK
jgi:hypothetical protein